MPVEKPMLQERYTRARKVLEAYIEAIERPGALFTWAPMVDGMPGYIAPAVEDRCSKAVVRELKKCVKEIDDHLQAMKTLEVDGL